MLGFAWFYFSESGLFKGLRPIQIKLFPSASALGQNVSGGLTLSTLLGAAVRLARLDLMTEDTIALASGFRKRLFQFFSLPNSKTECRQGLEPQARLDVARRGE